MAKSIPKFLFENIAILFTNFSNNKFTFDDAVRTLRKNERYTGQILSKLIEAGWLEKQRDSSDKRKKIYNIANFEKVIKELGDAAIEKQ